ncbi:MAG: nucleotidyltransferase domain-containing protein [Candidatus Riflebacteria bacterium]|nr:nucleotidyltransferase domain-containing protein [Candidatus Riflebacteria bacterium]
MSFSYTAKARKEHDLRVESDLEQIATRLLADFPGQIEALVLVGSFGRGEGTVVIRDGEVWPVHDYDIVIVGKDDLPREKVGWARLELAKTLGIPQVDLFPYRRGQLSAFGPSLLALDLKTASHVFHGDASVLDAIRPIDPTKIPIEEGRRLPPTTPRR